MYKYKIILDRVSGLLYESEVPKKEFIVKTKRPKSDDEIFDYISDMIQERYGLNVVSAEIINENYAAETAEEQGLTAQRDYAKRIAQSLRGNVYMAEFDKFQSRSAKNSMTVYPVKISAMQNGLFINFPATNDDTIGVLYKDITGTNWADEFILVCRNVEKFGGKTMVIFNKKTADDCRIQVPSHERNANYNSTGKSHWG